jgi:hypothetical protein
VFAWGKGKDGALGTNRAVDEFDPVLITEKLEEPVI